MRKVLIGTPAYDGRVDVWYSNSLINTIKLSIEKKVDIVPVYMSYDSLVQRARNDLVRLALEGNFDDLIFIDSDVEWQPEWVFKLLDYDTDVVGGIYPKKTDNIQFPLKALNDVLKVEDNGLVEVEGLPTGFLRISRNALQKTWDNSEEYFNEGRKSRMVFNIMTINGQLVSEDIIFCNKWRDLGGKVYLDPTMSCNHVGVKKYTYNFIDFLNNIGKQNGN